MQRTRPMISRIVAPSGVIDLNFTRSGSLSRSFLNLRMVSDGPSIASGGTMTLTREPSGKRASQIGLASSTRRPIWLTMRWQMLRSWELSRKRTPVFCILPATSMKQVLAPLTMMSAMSSRASSGSKRTVAQHVVADVLEQIFLLGDRHRHVLERDDLVDDVADFVARAVAVELAQAGSDRSHRSAR